MKGSLHCRHAPQIIDLEIWDHDASKVVGVFRARWDDGGASRVQNPFARAGAGDRSATENRRNWPPRPMSQTG